jgi:Tfp pilus assembly protein PilX
MKSKTQGFVLVAALMALLVMSLIALATLYHIKLETQAMSFSSVIAS